MEPHDRSKYIAEIDVKVIKFDPLKSSNSTLSAADFNPTGGSGGVTYKNKVFEVNDRGWLVFYFSDGIYAPKDIWFIQTVNPEDPSGKNNFTGIKPTKFHGYDAIEVFDHLKMGSRNSKWKFFIPIEYDKKVGVIDPEISNTNEIPDRPPGHAPSPVKGGR